MAANKNDPQKGNMKQKLMIAVIGVIVVFVAWQLLAGMGGGSSSPAPAPQLAKLNSPASAVNNVKGPGNSMPNNNLPTSSGIAAIGDSDNLTPQQSHPTFQTSSQILQIQQNSEREYLSNINKLQMLKLQKEIQETQESITSSRLATNTAEKAIANLLIKPEQPTVSASEYANNLASPLSSGQNIQSSLNGESAGNDNASPQSVTNQHDPDNGYVVLSVTQHGEKWKAVIGNGGKLFDVAIGGKLPNGFIIDEIDSEGVLLNKNGSKRRISISSSI